MSNDKPALSAVSPTEEPRILLDDCRVALNDWVHSYAPEMCGASHVAETQKRVSEAGGTLAYIGDLLSRLGRALHSALPDGVTQRPAAGYRMVPVELWQEACDTVLASQAEEGVTNERGHVLSSV